MAAALSTEYHAIVDRGLLLQIDAPDLALERHTLFADRPLSEFLAWVELVVDAINGALEGIDPDAVRLHVCWGNYEGPHTHDVALDEIQPLLYGANVGALVISMANARHAHEVRCFERRPLPDHMTLVAGVIDTTSNYVEHPEVVADRIVLAARAVGDPSRVIAGTDCGFDTTAGIGDVAPSLVWEKLAALRAGADLPPPQRLALPPLASDPEEEVAEALGQGGVAAGGAAVDATHGGQHEAGGVELEHQGQVAEVTGLQRHPFRAHRHAGVAGVVAADPHPELEGLDVGAVGGRLPDDEAERHQQVSGIAIQGVRAARALADVPGVHGVVDELGDGVEERRRGPMYLCGTRKPPHASASRPSMKASISARSLSSRASSSS